jgi:hypothetical protein
MSGTGLKSHFNSNNTKPKNTYFVAKIGNHKFYMWKSNVKRNESVFRRDRLKGLELDYNQYLQINQGIFTIRCQMMNIEYA